MQPIPPEHEAHEIRNVALLDLTGAQADSALDGVTRISHVSAILVPESLLPKLSPQQAKRSRRSGSGRKIPAPTWF